MNNSEKLKMVDETIIKLHEINVKLTGVDPIVKLTGVDPIYDVTIKKQFMATIESLMEWHQWLQNNLNAT